MAPTYAVPGWLLELLTLTNHMLKFQESVTKVLIMSSPNEAANTSIRFLK